MVLLKSEIKTMKFLVCKWQKLANEYLGVLNEKKNNLQALVMALLNFSVAVIMGAKAALEYYSLSACSTYCLLFLCWYSSDITVQTAVIGSLVQRLQFPARCC